MKEFIESLNAIKRYPRYVYDSSERIALIAEQHALLFSINLCHTLPYGKIKYQLEQEWFERLGKVNSKLSRIV